MANKHISHVKSTQIANKAFGEQQYPSISAKMGKRPSVSDLVDGEIAVNYAAGHETITIRNREIDSEGRVVENGAQNIVGFLNENVTYENELIAAAALSSIVGKTYSYLPEIESDSEYDTLNLIELHKRIKVLGELVTALSEKVDELEQRLSSGGEG